MNKIRGKAYVVGDNIDTDQIIPAIHLVFRTDIEEEAKNYGKYAMSGMDPKTIEVPFIEEDRYESDYTVMISGKNFGCGSSREHAPLSLEKAGIKAVVAQGYARIFYRNSVDGGFLIPYETKNRLIDEIKTGDEVEISENILKNITTNKEYILGELGDIEGIIKAGGIFNYAIQNGFMYK
ncbi:3-isopropylmalate dehydratase [Psychrilyobacter sp.]|uniref:LeuD/DmdB family oxidoreductase small subunit n=1 Tax=Psychrilyobacter sp. TaxID=2586924 RepID=UPI003019CD2D